MTSISGLVTVVKAKRELKNKLSNRQRRRLLALDQPRDAGATGQLRFWREQPVEEVRRIAALPSEDRSLHGLQVLCDVLGNVSIFRKVSREGLQTLAAEAQLRVLRPGEILCEEGELGNVMWVIVQGSLEAWQGGRPAPLTHGFLFASESSVDDRVSAPTPALKGLPTHPRPLHRSATVSSTDFESAMRSCDFGTLLNVMTPSAPGYSGELALLGTSSKRSCTMRAGLPDDPSDLTPAEVETVLLEITRQQFESTAQKIVRQETAEKMECLRKCTVFNRLADSQLSKVLYYMEKVTIPPHTTLGSVGEPVTNVYLVARGECKCLNDPRRQPQPTSAEHAHAAGSTEEAEGDGKHANTGNGFNKILGSSSARRRTAKNKGPKGREAGSREIAKLGPGHLIGDVEMARPSKLRSSASTKGSSHGGEGCVWQHSYVSVGPMTCFAIKPHDLEKRILDGNSALSRQMADDVALKLAWREQTQWLQGNDWYAVQAKSASRSDESNRNQAGGKPALVPTPPKEPRVGIDKPASARALADRYGSAIELTSKSVSFTGADSAPGTESLPVLLSTAQDRGDGIVSGLSSESPSLVPRAEASQAELSDCSRAVFQEEHRSNIVARQHRARAHPITGSVALGLSGRAGWGGSRVERRCPFFIEPPEALQYAKQKDIEQQQQAKSPLARLIGTSSSEPNTLKPTAPESRGTGRSKGSSSCRPYQSTSSVLSSFPRSYSARTGRAPAAPRFPSASSALPSLIPMRNL